MVGGEPVLPSVVLSRTRNTECIPHRLDPTTSFSYESPTNTVRDAHTPSRCNTARNGTGEGFMAPVSPAHKLRSKYAFSTGDCVKFAVPFVTTATRTP